MENQPTRVVLRKDGKVFDTWLPPFEQLPDVLLINNEIWIQVTDSYTVPQQYVPANLVFPVAAQYISERESTRVQAVTTEAPKSVEIAPAAHERPTQIAPTVQAAPVGAVTECEPCGKPVCESLPGQLST